MNYEIKDSRFPYCVKNAYCEGNICTVELKGSTLLNEHLELINYIMADKLQILYSISYNQKNDTLELLYW